MIARTLIVLAALASVPLAAQAKNVQDYLPLAVGNSWTYEHDFSDARSILDDPSIESTEEALIESREEITISILRTEVIDEDTYYVFSDVSTSVSEGVPRHFLNGKKLFQWPRREVWGYVQLPPNLHLGLLLGVNKGLE